MVTDSIADFLIRIQNGYMAGKRSIAASYSVMNMQIGTILKKEGYIADIEKEGTRGMKVTLKYTGSQPALTRVVRVSKPGQRIYERSRRLPHVLTGYGIAIVSTSQGIKTDNEARNANVGGEVLCKIW